ncbi:L,D-transpeptidase family protein [Jannaschia formosa]|uniref:L,D-transpeptidase family protein n=1 Tax=Jannaschia formosa TaxID=2259592 RepID=UPI000E1BD027|nr:L,D-transpeptidase [Jannaschia formosa]TFL18629.1 murein L,D-transpeptidase [Jannaschia formosa]
MRLALLPLALLAAPAMALSPEEITGATYDGGTVPEGQSGLTFKLQVLLDRADISPGIIDGYKGGMSESALRAFESREGFEVDGLLDPEVWSALGGGEADPVLRDYEITEEDASGLTEEIPDDVREKAEMDRLGYLRVSEKLAERFHMDEDVLIGLNPGSGFSAGETITVAVPGDRLDADVARIEIRKGDRRAVALDGEGNMLTSYPVAIGSEETPSPSGEMEVAAIAMDPTYSYLPDENFVADGVEEKLTLPPGPNGPVGSVWIDLSKPTYGLHGTDTPAKLFENRSHGCVRFTNWDIEELAHMVGQGVPVEFVE